MYRLSLGTLGRALSGIDLSFEVLTVQVCGLGLNRHSQVLTGFVLDIAVHRPIF